VGGSQELVDQRLRDLIAQGAAPRESPPRDGAVEPLKLCAFAGDDLDAGQGRLPKPLDDHPIDLALERREPLMTAREGAGSKHGALLRTDQDDDLGSSLGVAPRVLAWRVEIHGVSGVLDGPDANPSGAKPADERLDQLGLARVRVPGDTQTMRAGTGGTQHLPAQGLRVHLDLDGAARLEALQISIKVSDVTPSSRGAQQVTSLGSRGLEAPLRERAADQVSAT
jgi:hypothetical protein